MSIQSAFPIGTLVETRGIAEGRAKNARFDNDVRRALQKYLRADFTEMESSEDILMNQQAIQTNNVRIFATYNTCKGKIYIITEWDRSYTTILFPSEY